MTNALPLNTFFLIAGTIFLVIAAIGQSKLGFAEINPGFFGRFLALIIGITLLLLAVILVTLPTDILLEIIRNFLSEQIQLNMGSLNAIFFSN
jgi:hypothetical protein